MEEFNPTIYPDEKFDVAMVEWRGSNLASMIEFAHAKTCYVEKDGALVIAVGDDRFVTKVALGRVLIRGHSTVDGRFTSLGTVNGPISETLSKASIPYHTGTVEEGN